MSTSINLRDITALLRDAIYGNSALNTYCSGTLGGALTLQVGTNPGQPLGASDSPYCIIVPVGKSLGDTVQLVWEFDISFGYNDTTFSDYQDNGTKEMRGQYRIEEFGDLIIASVETVGRNYIIQNQRTQITSEAFPLHVGLHNLTLTTLNVNGGTIGLT